MTVTIRDATGVDLGGIGAIHDALIRTTTIDWRDEPYDAAERAEWFAAKRARGHPVVVAVDDRTGVVAGWGTWGDFRDSLVRPGYRFTAEHTIHVAEGHRGMGLADRLLYELVARAEAAGKRVLVGAIDGDNLRSIRFHERHGFVVTGRLPGVGEKFGRRLDLVLVQRELHPAG